MVRYRTWFVIASCCLGCEKDPPPSMPPVTLADEPVPTEPTPTPTEAPSGEDEGDLDEDEGEGSDADSGLDAFEAWRAAESAAAEALGEVSFVLTPALPSAWPPSDATVTYLAYPLVPAQTGVTTYELREARIAVVFSIAEGGVEARELPQKNKVLGRVSRGRGLTATDPVHGAEQALFRVASGEKSAEDLRFVLFRYERWLDDNAEIGADIRRRMPEFAKFLASVAK
jgi:hypothetical protein